MLVLFLAGWLYEEAPQGWNEVFSRTINLRACDVKVLDTGMMNEQHHATAARSRM